MKIIPIIILALFPASCAAGNTLTTIWGPGGKDIILKVSSSSDAVVIIDYKGLKGTIDNRGRPGIIEQLLGATAVDVNKEKK